MSLEFISVIMTTEVEASETVMQSDARAVKKFNDQYDLVRDLLLGSGTFGSVYKATSKQKNRFGCNDTVAIKEVKLKATQKGLAPEQLR